MILEAILLFVGGINIGAYAGYRLLLELKEEDAPAVANPFVRGGSPVPLVLLFCCALLGPFLLHTLLNRWKALYYPIFVLCGLVVAYDIYYVASLLV